MGSLALRHKPFRYTCLFQRQIFIDDAIGIQGGVNDEMQIQAYTNLIQSYY